MLGIQVALSCRGQVESSVALAALEAARNRGGRRHDGQGGRRDKVKWQNTEHSSENVTVQLHITQYLSPDLTFCSTTGMPMATRSKTRGEPVATPPKSPNHKSSVLLGKAQKGAEAARKRGAHLLWTLQEEQEQEVQHALGTKSGGGHSGGRGRGRSCGRSHGRGHGCEGGCVSGAQSSGEPKTPAVEDVVFTATLEMDGLDEHVSHSFTESTKTHPHTLS